MFILKIWWRIWGVIIERLRTKKKGVPCWSSVLSVSKVGSSKDHMENFLNRPASRHCCVAFTTWLCRPKSEWKEWVIWETLNKMPISNAPGGCVVQKSGEKVLIRWFKGVKQRSLSSTWDTPVQTQLLTGHVRHWLSTCREYWDVLGFGECSRLGALLSNDWHEEWNHFVWIKVCVCGEGVWVNDSADLTRGKSV